MKSVPGHLIMYLQHFLVKTYTLSCIVTHTKLRSLHTCILRHNPFWLESFSLGVLHGSFPSPIVSNTSTTAVSVTKTQKPDVTKTLIMFPHSPNTLLSSGQVFHMSNSYIFLKGHYIKSWITNGWSVVCRKNTNAHPVNTITSLFCTILFSCNTQVMVHHTVFHCPLITNCTHFLFVTEINQSLSSENKELRKTLSDQPGEKKLCSRAVSVGAKLIAT